MTKAVPSASSASELRIAATVAPVHSLVAMVSAGIAEPTLIIRPGASPHDYALKPSEVRSLDEADVVFWVGESLEPWMAKAVTTLAGDAEVIELGEVDGIEKLAFREGGIWQDHGHHEEAEDTHDHAGDVDPHLWLDPDNALVWLSAIADRLADTDPVHAEDYRQNAQDAALEIETTVSEIKTLLQPISERPYVVFHDAYQYFEHRFGLHPLGAVSLGDGDRADRDGDRRDRCQKGHPRSYRRRPAARSRPLSFADPRSCRKPLGLPWLTAPPAAIKVFERQFFVKSLFNVDHSSSSGRFFTAKSVAATMLFVI